MQRSLQEICSCETEKVRVRTVIRTVMKKPTNVHVYIVPYVYSVRFRRVQNVLWDSDIHPLLLFLSTVSFCPQRVQV